MFFFSFEDLTKELRKKRLIKQIRDMMQQIHTRCCIRHNGAPNAAPLAPLTINTRVIVAAFMVYLHTDKVFEVMGPLETKLLESATTLLTAFEGIVRLLSSGVRFNDLDAQLTAPFPGIVATYLNDFNAWKVPDAEKLHHRITNALNVLMDLAATPMGDHSDMGSRVQAEIIRLRGKLQQLSGEAAVTQFDNDRLTRTVANTPSMQPLALTRDFIVANEALAYELMWDASFQLVETGVFPGEDADPAVIRRRRTLHDEFWTDLEADFERHDFLNAYLALGTICKDLLETLEQIRGGEEGELLRVEVAELLDIERMQTTNFLDEWGNCVELITKLAGIIMRVQYPTREEDSRAEWAVLQAELAEVDDNDGAVFSSALHFAFKYAQCIRLDAANERLRRIAPIVREHGVKYMQEKLQIKLNAGMITLGRTKAFLEPQLGELPLRKFVQLTKGDSTLLRKVHRAALVDLVKMGPPAPPLPEVFMYDQGRLKRFAQDFKKLSDAAIVMRVICSFSPESDSQLLQSDISMQQEIETVLREVSSEETMQPVSLLCCISDMVLAHSATCVEEVETLFRFIEQTKLARIVSPAGMEGMRAELQKVFEADFEMRTTA